MSRFSKMAFLFSSILVCGAIPLFAQSDLDQRVAREMDSLVATYKHLHANPELSTQEKESSALLAAELRKLGYEVTDHFGRYDSPGLVSYGIVGVLRNGPGATVYVRTDLDALPVTEQTGAPYASSVKMTDDKGVVTTWNLELGSPNSVLRRGWKPSDLRPGQKVSFKGYGGRKVLTRVGGGTSAREVFAAGVVTWPSDCGSTERL